MKSRLLSIALLVSLAVLSFTAAAGAEPWPDNPVTVTDATDAPDVALQTFQAAPAVYVVVQGLEPTRLYCAKTERTPAPADTASPMRTALTSPAVLVAGRCSRLT